MDLSQVSSLAVVATAQSLSQLFTFGWRPDVLRGLYPTAADFHRDTALDAFDIIAADVSLAAHDPLMQALHRRDWSFDIARTPRN